MTNIGIDRWEAKEAAGDSVDFDYSIENLGWFGVTLYWCNFIAFRIKLILALGAGFAFVLFAFAIELG